MPRKQDPAVPATDTAAASEPVDRLELLFEQRVARALDRLGVPRGEQIRQLTALVERLTERIDTLGAAIVVPPARAATTDETPGVAGPLVKRAASPRRSRRSPAAAAANPKAGR